MVGVPTAEIVEAKRDNISLPVKESIQKEGKKPGLFHQIVKKAVAMLRDKIRVTVVPVKPELKVDVEVFRQMQAVRKKLFAIMKSVRDIDAQIKDKQKRLDDLTGISGAFKRKEKTELMNSISALVTERTKQSVLDKLHQYDKEAKQGKYSCKNKENVPKKSMEIE